MRLSGPSYAEQFYDEIMKWWQWNCMPSEISFMEKTGAFPSVWIKAPKGLISLSSPYGKPSIIPTEHVDEYRRQSTKLEKVKATVESDDSEVVRKAEHEFDQWINLHMTVTKRTDWQFIPMISKDHTWGLPD
ncbi:hypothetical protein AvCA_04190 [Azotobacter vinelandii CA]|uniref:Uncharacterized protein n=2 Tax=Azotobacter vinelandii TaxID=354 RepID=C1DJ92_AZOVD|nr:hypothetical protein Avin_04190 [Azotobacter vinelandii DJ]AGK15614.1 hypothetical protein AvCA_04190 [Azotobacter vinelandii CA]AGK19286.1 hypothetical protein AvCA6_04190 [Azotobacter vinelandii CA6]